MPDPGPQFPYLNPTPANVQAFNDLQRKQMLAQMLMQGFQQQSQTPADWNSMRVVPKRSALSALAPVLTAALAGKSQQGLMEAQNNYYQGLMGKKPTAPTATPAPSMAPSAPAGQQSTVAPLTAQMPPQGGLQAPDSSVSPIPPGMDPGHAQQLAMIAQANPEYFKAVIAPQLAPTEIEKLGHLAGMSQDEIQAAGRAAIRKQTTNVENVRPGGTVFDVNAGRPVFYSPQVPQGSTPNFNANGQVTSVSQIPGAEAAATAESAGKKAGEVSQTPLKIGVDANGRDVYEFPKPPALVSEGTAGGASRIGGAQAPKVATPSTASKSVLAAQEEGGRTGQQYSNELAKNATGATEIRRSLSELKNLAAKATPSGLNEGKMKLGSYMIAAGVSPETTAKYLGVDVGALQAAQKQTSTLAVGVIHSMTNRGTNFDLETFMRNNPNLNMSDPSSFQKVVDYMDSKAKQEIAKQKDFVQWKKGVSPEDWESGHTAHWLEQQNQQIDQGRFNSRPPLSSFVRP